MCYEIGRIEYSYANVFFASMISNLFYDDDDDAQICKARPK